MDKILPHYYFDLTDFAHSDLFKLDQPVWIALSNISKYLSSKSLNGIQVKVPRGTFFENKESIFIGEGTVVEEGAYIKGPCIIGNDCQIRHGAYIRGNVITGNKCVIGHSSELKGAILLNGAQAAHFAYVGDSILGARSNLGAGTKCANLRFDHGEVIVHCDGQRFPTGLKKFGAIFGDEASTGCNSVTNPGTLMGPRSRCYPCTNVGGFVPAGQTVKPGDKAIFSP